MVCIILMITFVQARCGMGSRYLKNRAIVFLWFNLKSFLKIYFYFPFNIKYNRLSTNIDKKKKKKLFFNFCIIYIFICVYSMKKVLL
jgi:amino acid permease